MGNNSNITFIVGIPRSGTTWLLTILENHPDTLALTPQLLGIKVENITKETGLFVRNLSDEEILKKINNVSNGKLLIEKTPSHIFELNRIKKLFPQSKIILIERNPIDIIYSMIQENPFWRDSPRTIDDAVNLYKDYISAINSFDSLDYILKYEDLWENTIDEINKLFKYLNLSTSNVDKIIEKTKHGKALPSKLQTVFRKGTPGQGIKNFSSEQINMIESSLQKQTLKILITNHHLTGLTGSELLTLTLAKELSNQGHNVTIYSKFINNSNISEYQNFINFIDDLESIKNKSFDIAHIHHNISAIEVRSVFPDLPMVFLSQGILPFLEQPLSIDLKFSRYLALSEEIRDNLFLYTKDRGKIPIVRNLIKVSEYFTSKLPNVKPQKALVISRNLDKEKEKIILDACKIANLELEFIGGRFGEVSQEEVKNKIENADIVFSLGRGAIQSMIANRGVIIYDYLGGDGFVLPETFHEIKKNNFSGRRYKRNYTADDLVNEIKKYDYNKVLLVSSLAREIYSSENITKKLVNIYKEVINENIGESISEQNRTLIDEIRGIIKETVIATKGELHFTINEKEEEYHKKLLEIAEDLIETRHFTSAKLVLNKMLKDNQDDLDVLNDLSVIDILEENFDSAMTLISNILILDPNNEIAQGNLKYLETLNTNRKIRKEITI